MTRSRAARSVLTAVILLGFVAACSVGVDDRPRDIDPDAVLETLAPGSNSDAEAIGSGRIYLLAPETPESPAHLEPVARDVAADNPQAVLGALLAGPNSDEFIRQLRTAIPSDVELNRAPRLRSGGVLELDVNEQLLSSEPPLSSDQLISAVAQIVYTASMIEGVSSVVITVDGAKEQWPAGNGELQADPLTVYDYPGFEPSTQPAYPGIPPAEGAP